MADELPTLLLELLEVLVVAVGSLLTAGAGLVLESRALSTFLTGEAVIGIWFLVVGAIVLYAGVYLLGYRQLRPRVRALLNGA